MFKIHRIQTRRFIFCCNQYFNHSDILNDNFGVWLRLLEHFFIVTVGKRIYKLESIIYRII